MRASDSAFGALWNWLTDSLRSDEFEIPVRSERSVMLGRILCAALTLTAAGFIGVTVAGIRGVQDGVEWFFAMFAMFGFIMSALLVVSERFAVGVSEHGIVICNGLAPKRVDWSLVDGVTEPTRRWSDARVTYKSSQSTFADVATIRAVARFGRRRRSTLYVLNRALVDERRGTEITGGYVTTALASVPHELVADIEPSNEVNRLVLAGLWCALAAFNVWGLAGAAISAEYASAVANGAGFLSLALGVGCVYLFYRAVATARSIAPQGATASDVLGANFDETPAKPYEIWALVFVVLLAAQIWLGQSIG